MKESGTKKAMTALRKLVLGSILPVAVMLLWYHGTRNQGTVVPSIGSVLDVLMHPFRPPPNLDSLPLATSTLVSLLRVFCGFIIAVITAVPLGFLVGRVRLAREFFTPIIEMARPICPVAWLPLAIVLFGFTSLGTFLFGRDSWKHGIFDQLQVAMVAVIWWGAFFPIFVNTVHGVMNVRRLFVEVALTNGATRLQVARHVILPAALPSIISGIRIGMGTAWMVIVAAEFFPGTRAGLGYLITTSHQVAEYEYAFASIIVIGVVGIAMNAVLFKTEETVARWKTRER